MTDKQLESAAIEFCRMEGGYGMNSELFDVVVFHRETKAVWSIVGHNLRGHDGTSSGRGTAEMRQRTMQERMNDRYDCLIVPAGSCVVGGKVSNAKECK